ncbi:Cleavage/polyadenylation specificity factor subunit 5 [Haematococcus lacustris]
MSLSVTYSVFPLTNYSFGAKEPRHERDGSVEQRLARLRSGFERDGMRRSVEGVLIVHEHNHPHVLLLQLAPSFFKLPGGRLRPGEDEREGLKRKLGNSLSPSNPLLQSVWDVGEVAGQYWRPNFDTLFYPYNPPHVSRPKECKKVFVVPLPEKAMFAVPRNMRLVAVPLFELYDNISRFGPVISALPVLLSKFRLTLVVPLPSISISSLEAAAQQQPVAEEMKA